MKTCKNQAWTAITDIGYTGLGKEKDSTKPRTCSNPFILHSCVSTHSGLHSLLHRNW